MFFKASSKVAVSCLLASLGFFALHCGSDDSAPGGGGGSGGSSAGQTTGGSGGSVSTGGSSAGMSSGGTSAGTSSGGTSSGGSGVGGSAGSAQAGSAGAAGSGGTSGGAGGSGGGSGGTSGSGGGGGASGSGGSGGGGATFAQVKDLLSKSCAGGKCHSMGSQQMDWTTATGLYDRLTKPIASGPHCVGKTPVVANNPDMSLLLQVVKGSVMCGTGDNVARMPDDCPGQRACLTDQQIKVISDWIAAGAPM